ncbi:hypothetical protein PLESTB_000544200 [Pleodorina starrii]|uniref:Uncharacterized protein n=1 Tax=Pleodorina starrii TaxID=330485 RepID=A0A9W6BGS6_9CHLO|nr:hypothetical protein PLESTB_000544200 [Pleodorina starrii]GLC77088.1 hypothetical protein PLESTF_001883000 [Pleodorina starrii]
MAKGTIVVSLRSKGLPSFTRSTIFDFRHQLVQFATEFLDLFFAFVVSIACLSWSAWISIGVIVAAIAGTQTTNYAEASSEVVLVFFMYIVLPLTILLIFVFNRRERALRSLTDFKASFVSLLINRPAGTTAAQQDASADLYRKAAAFIEDVRQYLQHRRPYARHFFLPYRSSTPSSTDELLKVSTELGLYLRRVHRGVRDMHLAVARLRATGVSEALILSLSAKVEAIHAATERLSSIKEMRTPVVLRATFRWLVVVVIPVAMGPFWNSVGSARNMRTFAGIVGVLSHIALLGILDSVVAMEDPFDEAVLDTISLFEVLDQVGVMTTPTDYDGYDTDGLGIGRETGGGAAQQQMSAPHVAMYMSGGGAAGEAAAGAGAATGEMPMLAGAQQPLSVTDSAGAVSSVGPLEQLGQAQRHGGIVGQMSGMPAMRGSTVTSETAVGPPSGMDPYSGGAGGGGAVNLPSITSPPLHDVGAAVRVPNMPPMPPMPALAGSPIYRTGAVAC